MTTTFERQVKGLLGTKLGMTQVWDENGKFVPVTVVKADSNVVTQLRNEDKDGYNAVQIGFGAIDPRKVTKPLAGHFAAAGVTPRRHVVELRTSDAAEYELGQELSVELFEAGDDIGGQFALAMRIPGKEEFDETLRYFRHKLADTGVDVKLGARVEADDLEGYDEVAIATLSEIFRRAMYNGQ